MEAAVSVVLTLTMLGNAGATCDTSLPETRPDTRYEEVAGASPAGSEVRDRVTGLIWQRCVVGMTWDGSTCTGSPSALGWTAAMDLAASAAGAAAPSAAAPTAVAPATAWRVPNSKELVSLIEWRCVSPPLNTTWFPNTPMADAGTTWTSTTRPDLDLGRMLQFDPIFIRGLIKTSQKRVRLVRTGLPDNCSSFDSCSRNTGVR